MPVNSAYYTNIKETCPEKVRFVGKEKFPKKLMGVAVYDRGMSEPLFRTSEAVAINTSIYINQCLEKRLLPFIHKYNGDLASSHYSKLDGRVNYVDKKSNPPNVPQAQPNDQLKTFGDIWFKRFTREVGKLQQSKS